MINDTLYNDNAKKITFSMSFISAAIWASTVTKKALSLANPTFRTWASLYTDIKTLFIYVDVKNKAIAWLTTT